MGKILFWVIVIVGVLLVTRILTHHGANRRAKASSSKEDPLTIKKTEEMVRCAHCQVYLPQSDALKQDDHFWCGPEHAKQGVRQSR